jgi:hypothetical protein
MTLKMTVQKIKLEQILVVLKILKFFFHQINIQILFD